MFKISYIVDDKRLPEMIRATFDHVSDLKVVPLDNLMAVPATSIDKPRSHKALPAPSPKSASTESRNFIQELGWEGGFKFKGDDVGRRCKSLGLNFSSRFHVIGHEVKHKRVKKVSLGQYVVL